MSRTRIHCTTATLLIAITICGSSAVRADQSDESALLPSFEISAFGGYRFGGEFDLENPTGTIAAADHRTFSVALDLARNDSSQYELFYSRQPTQLKANSAGGPQPLKIEYLQIGGTLFPESLDRAYPYLVGTMGITRMTPEASGTDASTNFSASLGGGLRIPVNRHFALRLEARGYMTFVNSDSVIFCSSNELGGACRFAAKGSSFYQFELLAGVAFGF